MSDNFSIWAQRAAGLPDPIDLTPLKAEASFRSFYRITSGLTKNKAPDPGLVLMVSPPEKESNDQFEILARVFADAGIPVPGIVAREPDHGWYLLTDLGARDLARAYEEGDQEAALEAAIRTLVDLQAVTDPAIPPYTAQRFRDEITIFEDWFPGVDERPLPDPVANVFSKLVARTQQQPQCAVHRDYHCRNLLFDGDRFGVVDFQDALVGPAAYDLASLLHDCYYRFEPAEVSRWTARYLALTPLELSPDAFAVDLTFCAVQRQLKAIGIFARLKRRDGKSSHLEHIVPVFTRVRALCAEHPLLEPLGDWLDTIDAAGAVARLETWSDYRA